jgi:hypothetical protein
MRRLHTGKHITKAERISYLVLASFLLGYGTISFINDSLYIPGKFGGAIFHGIPLLILYLSMLCFVAYSVLKIVGHYDNRENELAYRRFSKLVSFLGFGLFIVALLLETFFFQNSTNP